MCGEKYELKINDVRFISHPMLLHNKQEKKEMQKRNPTVFSNNNIKTSEVQDPAENILVFNVVFALRVFILPYQCGSDMTLMFMLLNSFISSG